MLDKKQIWAVFLLKLKMGCIAADTICKINHAFGPGTANEITVHVVHSLLTSIYFSSTIFYP